MSDIKRILAAAEDAEQHTRFPCLAVLRYAAATVVMVLALAVVALVIHAVLRSEDIRLSVNDGYIGADKLWSETRVMARAYGINKASRPTAQAGVDFSPYSSQGTHPYSEGTISIDPFRAGGDADLPVPNPVMSNGAATVTLRQADVTNLRVTLIANNPGGRTKIDCNDTTVTVMDGVQSVIGKLELGNFTVPPQTTITLQKRLKVTDNDTLQHIWEYHGGERSFSVKVQVSANVTSYPLGKKTRTKPLTYLCPHVTLGLTDDEAYLAANGDVECSTG
ncbi:unnamed protein product [Alopecurus aequalis]